MVTRPSLFAFGATLGALVFVGSLGFTPVLVSHDSPPGAPVRFWWARLAPRGYAVYALRSAPAVIVPEAPSSCPDPESQTRAWLTLAAGPDADQGFRHLFARFSRSHASLCASGLGAHRFARLAASADRQPTRLGDGAAGALAGAKIAGHHRRFRHPGLSRTRAVDGPDARSGWSALCCLTSA